MDVGSILDGGFKFVIRRPRLVAVWAAIYGAVTIAGGLLLRNIGLNALDTQRQVVASSGAIAAPASLPSSFWPLLLVFYVVIILGWVIAFAAVVRAVVRPQDSRFAYLRLGMDELRLIGLGIVLVVIAIAVEVVAILIVGVLTFAAGQAVAAVAASFVALILLGLVIWVQVRFSLAGALTIMRRDIVIREAWRVTRGSFWRLFAVYLVIGVIALIVTLMLTAALNPEMVGALTSMNPQAMMVAAQARMAHQAGGLSALLIVQSVIAALVNTVLGTVTFAAIATAAQQTVEQEHPAAEFA